MDTPVRISGWELETYEAIRAEVTAAGMLDFDPAHSVVLVERWFKYNPPMNDKHAMGTARFIADIESDRLRERAEEALTDADASRLAKQAARDAEKEAARQTNIARLGQMGVGSGNSNLTNTRFMRGAR